MNKKSRIIIPLVSSLGIIMSGCFGPRDPVEPSSSIPTSSPTSEPTSAPTSSPSSSSSSSTYPEPSWPSMPSTSGPQTEFEPTSIHLSRRDVGLIVTYEYDEEGEITDKIIDAEKIEVEYDTLPRQVYKPNVNFSSTNTAVATVIDNSDDRVITIQSVKEGVCQIIATSDDGSAVASLNVFVSAWASKRNANSYVKSLSTKQAEAGLTTLDKIQINRTLINERIKNDSVFQSTISEETYIVSKENAFFFIDSDDTYMKVEGGSESYEHSSWVIFTDEYYDTYLFHVNGANKTYMVADSTSFISQGKSRYEAACAVLDSLFTSGSSFLTRNFSDVLGTSQGDPLTTSSVGSSTRLGLLNDDCLVMSYGASYKNEEADRDDEDNYYIPAGTKYDISLDFDIVASGYHVQNSNLFQSMKYDLNENDEVNHYENNYLIEEQYIVEDILIHYPLTTEYAKVDSIFDL